jgi:hypothetical protein
MAGQRVASLEILFEMATGQAIADIVKFGGVVDKTMQGAIQAANQADAAMKHVGDLSGPAAQVTRSAAEIRREYNAIERAGEGMVRQIEREIIAFGKSADEMQRTKRELAAVAAESRGMTELASRIRVAQGALDGMGGTARLTRSHTLNLGYQFSDLGIQMAAAAGSSEPLKMAFMALIQQGSQIQGIMAQAGIGFRGLAVYVWGLVAPFAPLIAVAGAAYGALKLVTSSLNSDAGLKEYAKTLGLTKDEMAKLKDVGITTGDVMVGIWKTLDQDKTLSNFIKKAKTWFGELRDDIVAGMRFAGATLYGALVGGYRASVETWRQWPAAFADFFIQGVNKALDGINWLARGVNTLLGTNVLGQIGHLQND